MKNQQCPLCYTKLEVVDCAPCFDCGHLEIEKSNLKAGARKYVIYNIYSDLNLQLCEFCAIDFGSYNSSYWGFKNKTSIGYGEFNFVKEVQYPAIEKDKYCPSCYKRLKFIEFLADIRRINKAD